MAEFMEVMAARRRLCESTDYCRNCPVVKDDILQRDCYRLINESSEYVEQKVMQWASEHPIKTNADKFKEVFGVEAGFDDTCSGIKCPSSAQSCSECEYREFWLKEYVEPKSEENK